MTPPEKGEKVNQCQGDGSELQAVYVAEEELSCSNTVRGMPSKTASQPVIDVSMCRFTFSHLADAFIQSDLQLGVHKAINLEEANIQRKCQ